MKRLRALIRRLSPPTSAAQGQTLDSPLKLAFQRARASGNIEDVCPVLKDATLYVVAGSSGPPNEANDLFLTKSPKNGRMCVTVADHENLLRHLPSAMEVIVVYADGGDYITHEQMEWFRGMLGKSLPL